LPAHIIQLYPQNMLINSYSRKNLEVKASVLENDLPPACIS
jgi:hypothetical protein